VLQLIQNYLPLNPGNFGPVRWDTALNTAVSFVTNTNWQSYGGEQTMGHLVQMAGLAVQNFLSAAVGIAAVIALIRGFARKGFATIGNFWTDLTRSILYVLLPLAIIWALVFASQGVVQTLEGPAAVRSIEGQDQSVYRGRSHPRRGSRSSARTGAVSSMPIPRTRLKTYTPDRLHAGAGASAHPCCPPFHHGAMLNNRRQGMLFTLP